MKPGNIVPLILIFFLSGCGQNNLVPEILINFQNPTRITETGFEVSWSINPPDYTSLTLVLAKDPSFNSIIATKTFNDRLVSSTSFESLTGATTYYYRISLVREPGSLFISDTKSIDLPFRSDKVNFATPDSANLYGRLVYLETINGKRPAVIMMHEYRIFVNNWLSSDILKALVAEGYICLVFYNRGHGQSSYFEDISLLSSDPEYLANDLRGAMAFIKGSEKVRSDSVALMGGSMGGTMALTGNGYTEVLTSVSLSGSNHRINYMFPGIKLKSVLYLAGENDIVNTGTAVIDFPGDAESMFKVTDDPRKILIIKNSSAHGTDLLEYDEIHEEIFQWIMDKIPI